MSWAEAHLLFHFYTVFDVLISPFYNKSVRVSPSLLIIISTQIVGYRDIPKIDFKDPRFKGKNESSVSSSGLQINF